MIEFPTIEIVPPVSWEGLDRAIDRMNSYDWIIFTSVNGVEFFWQRLKERGKDRRFPPRSKVCAIGPATARSIEGEWDLRSTTRRKSLLPRPSSRGLKRWPFKGKRILLARVKEARDVFPKGLKEMGAEVDVVEVYRTVKPEKWIEETEDNSSPVGKVDVVTFTSSSTVNHFIELLEKETLRNC